MLILLVEDDMEARRSLAEFLRDHGHEVLECENGIQALGAAEVPGIQLVVSDIHMSGLNGIELLKKVRRVHSIPFILMTAYSEFLDDLRTMPELECVCMLKPLDLESLFDLVQGVERHGSLLNEK